MSQVVDAPDLSVVIVTWNNEALIVPCLRSIAAAAEGLSVEVIVVDNASRDGTAEAAQRTHPSAIVLANTVNVGFPRANNQGLERASGRHVLFVNPDTEVRGDALRAAVAELDRQPGIGMVGVRLVYPDGRVQYECARRAYRLRHLFWEAFYLHEIFRHNAVFAHQLIGDWDHLDDRDVEAISGAFMMMPRAAATAVGGMPAEVFMSHEDLALCLRVRARGLRIRYLAGHETLHLGGASRAKSTTPLDLLEGEIRVRLLRERGGPVRAALARPAFAFRSAARLAIAAVASAVPGLARLKASRPKAFAVRLHALHLLWALAPNRVARAFPRAESGSAPLVLLPSGSEGLEDGSSS